MKIWITLLRFASWSLAAILLFTAPSLAHEKSRLIVLTDIGGEPDDSESMVRLLVYSNEFDIEGLVAVQGGMAKGNPIREDLIRERIAAYAKVRDNLLIHAPGFPATETLLAVTASGQSDGGIKGTGPGKETTGSRRIIEAADRADNRPLWITCWAGTSTLMQALLDVRASRSPAEVDKFVAKLRVYSISDQDDAGPWIRREFPRLFYIVSPSRPMPDWSQYHLATWSGISGDRKFQNGPRYHFDMVDNPWLAEHIMLNHGPLGALYPPLKYIMEGDTPSWLGLLDNGLGWEASPSYGGWGGRYVWARPPSETHPIWTNNNLASRDTVSLEGGTTNTSDQATVWRWRVAYQNDFAARMNWCVADAYGKANHNPLPVLNGDRSTDILYLTARAGSLVLLSAKGTSDPDGNNVKVLWWIYDEAGNVTGATLTQTEGLDTVVRLPAGRSSGHIHVILQAEDDGAPHLFAYRRTVITIGP